MCGFSRLLSTLSSGRRKAPCHLDRQTTATLPDPSDHHSRHPADVWIPLGPSGFAEALELAQPHDGQPLSPDLLAPAAISRRLIPSKPSSFDGALRRTGGLLLAFGPRIRGRSVVTQPPLRSAVAALQFSQRISAFSQRKRRANWNRNAGVPDSGGRPAVCRGLCLGVFVVVAGALGLLRVTWRRLSSVSVSCAQEFCLDCCCGRCFTYFLLSVPPSQSWRRFWILCTIGYQHWSALLRDCHGTRRREVSFGTTRPLLALGTETWILPSSSSMDARGIDACQVGNGWHELVPSSDMLHEPHAIWRPGECSLIFNCHDQCPHSHAHFNSLCHTEWSWRILSPTLDDVFL